MANIPVPLIPATITGTVPTTIISGTVSASPVTVVAGTYFVGGAATASATVRSGPGTVLDVTVSIASTVAVTAQLVDGTVTAWVGGLGPGTQAAHFPFGAGIAFGTSIAYTLSEGTITVIYR